MTDLLFQMTRNPIGSLLRPTRVRSGFRRLCSSTSAQTCRDDSKIRRRCVRPRTAGEQQARATLDSRFPDQNQTLSVPMRRPECLSNSSVQSLLRMPQARSPFALRSEPPPKSISVPEQELTALVESVIEFNHPVTLDFCHARQCFGREPYPLKRASDSPCATLASFVRTT
jgi:hypothetical protein